MMHPAVRETLATRLAELQTEVLAAEDQARRSRARAEGDYDRWQRLVETKRQIQASLAAEDAPDVPSSRSSDDRAPVHAEGVTPPPAERATTYPEGETPPPADRAPTS